MRGLLAALGLLAAPVAAAPFSHALFDQVLRQRVDAGGRVDYPGLKAARETLDAYVDRLAQCSPHSHPDRFSTAQHELAYWIDAYNAFVLRGVIDAYPVASVLLYLPPSEAAYLRQHRELKVVFAEYDWALNAQPAK